MANKTTITALAKDTLEKAVTDSVCRAIKSQMPDTYDNMPVNVFFAPESVLPKIGMSIAHIRVKTPNGVRLFDIRISEVTV